MKKILIFLIPILFLFGCSSIEEREEFSNEDIAQFNEIVNNFIDENIIETEDKNLEIEPVSKDRNYKEPTKTLELKTDNYLTFDADVNKDIGFTAYFLEDEDGVYIKCDEDSLFINRGENNNLGNFLSDKDLKIFVNNSKDNSFIKELSSDTILILKEDLEDIENPILKENQKVNLGSSIVEVKENLDVLITYKDHTFSFGEKNHNQSNVVETDKYIDIENDFNPDILILKNDSIIDEKLLKIIDEKDINTYSMNKNKDILIGSDGSNFYLIPEREDNFIIDYNEEFLEGDVIYPEINDSKMVWMVPGDNEFYYPLDYGLDVQAVEISIEMAESMGLKPFK